MIEPGRVSVIIPTYNRPRWLPAAVESVLDQDYPDIELIVVNDGSSNENVERALDPYRDRIVYIYQENAGQGAAVNAGIRAATGEFINRLDDDDVFLPGKVAAQVEAFQQNPEVGVVGGGCHVIDADGQILTVMEAPDFSKYGLIVGMLLNWSFAQAAVMVRKECHDKVGLYRTDISSEDWEMWLRIIRHYSVDVIRKPLAGWRRHSLNLTSANPGKNDECIRSFICEMMDNLSVEEMMPDVSSVPHGYDVRGAIFLKHCLYKRAGQEFMKAREAEPQDPIHGFWLGISLRSIGYLDQANQCFSRAAQIDDGYHDAVQRSIDLTSRIRIIDHNDKDVTALLMNDLDDEFEELLGITIQRAKKEEMS